VRNFLLITFLFLTPLFSLAANPDAQPKPQPELAGKIIREIKIVRKDIFEDKDNALIYRTANDLKVPTRVKLIERELRFKKGEPYDEFTIRETERQLRALRFMRDAVIRGQAVGNNEVDLTVQVKEVWTFIPQVSYSSKSGETSRTIGVSEGNLFGLGKRIEVLDQVSEKRESLETVYDDQRLGGTFHRLTLGHFDRKDGLRQTASISRPFLSLLDQYSWNVTYDSGDGVGRLFKDGSEDYIYRRDGTDFDTSFIVAKGEPNELLTRYSIGFRYQDEVFTQADQDDYEDLDLDPTEVRNDIEDLAQDRRYIGPTIGFQSVDPDFISMNYIDRFERYEDYNLGNQLAFNLMLAPKFLSSDEDAVLLSGHRAAGLAFSENSFIRAEGGVSSRIARDSVSNSLLRGEVKFFNVLGDVRIRERFFGRHTLAAQLATDYGMDLDKDRQFLVGADNSLRGYKTRAFEGSKRLVLNLEDRVHLIDNVAKIVSVGAAGFIDIGGATDENLTRLIGDNIYSDIGIGLRLGFPRSSGGGVVRLDVAFPLRAGPDGSERLEPRFSLGAGQLFGARTRAENTGVEAANVEVGFDR
jgi:outer membrane protein assembly factor BamA